MQQLREPLLWRGKKFPELGQDSEASIRSDSTHSASWAYENQHRHKQNFSTHAVGATSRRSKLTSQTRRVKDQEHR
ncbi:hypothetical protein RB195_025386 [Necator americanus]|uniref:Uncharacterized protein n=1 Tax=Necator americanus TaxID=51031 RepID=A0ABR1ES33_NECAM